MFMIQDTGVQPRKLQIGVKNGVDSISLNAGSSSRWFQAIFFTQACHKGQKVENTSRPFVGMMGKVRG